MPIEARIVAAQPPAQMPQPAPSGAPSLAELRVAQPADVAINSDKSSERRPQAVKDAAQPRIDDGADAAAAGAPVPLAADATYHPVSALDRPPSPLLRPDVCYPHGATGEVVYELLIDEAGVVTQAAVLTVKPLGLFTAAAAELCSKLRFSPAIKDGRAVRSRVRFVVGPG
jgi:outer membrane biosynthesis protein TonB